MSQSFDRAFLIICVVIAGFAIIMGGQNTKKIAVKLPAGEIVQTYAEKLSTYPTDEEVDESAFRVEIGESTLTLH